MSIMYIHVHVHVNAHAAGVYMYICVHNLPYPPGVNRGPALLAMDMYRPLSTAVCVEPTDMMLDRWCS